MAQDILASDFLAPDIWDRMTQRLITIWPRTVWTYDISAPDISAKDILAPDILAPDISAPDISAPDISAPDFLAPVISAPDILAQDISTQDISATTKLYLFYYALYAQSVFNEQQEQFCIFDKGWLESEVYRQLRLH